MADKNDALEKALEQIQKQYGKGSIMKMGDFGLDIDAIPTGSVSLDIATGIGGYPKGRIVEIYGAESSGKTTLTLHAIAEVQKAGGTAAFIDAEHALDPVYAKNLGVNIEELLVSQPDTGEQALEICEMLARSGAVDIIVIDSVAALVPKAEIQGEMGDSHVGLQARLMSQALRKITGVVNKTNTCVIFINQLREKIGVMFGCLHADTMIPFTNGEFHTIREIVDNKIKGNVWAYDEKTKSFKESKIIDWHYNGEVVDNSDYIHITTEALDSIGGECGITVTQNHRIMTDHGWKEAKDIVITDKILTQYKSIVNGSLGDFLYGTLCGDSTLAIRAKNTAAIKFVDSTNPDYLNWKISKLSPFIKFSKIMANQYQMMSSQYSSELAVIKKLIGARDPLVMLRDHYSDMGLAVWYMDDGHFDSLNSHYRASISVKRFKNDVDKLAQIQGALADHGLIARCDVSSGNFIFDKSNTIKLFEKIYKFIPECMQYKLGSDYRGKYEDFTLDSTLTNNSFYVPIKEIRIASDKQMRQRGKYDLTIEGFHNYLAGGVSNGLLVHNSPLTTSGGKALKFYASMRLDVARIETLKKGDEMYGNRVRVKIVKNKVAPPFKKAEFDILYGKGISLAGDLLDTAVAFHIIDKAGSWYSYNNERIGQGRDKAVAFLTDNPDILKEVQDKITACVKEPGLIVDEDGVVIS